MERPDRLPSWDKATKREASWSRQYSWLPMWLRYFQCQLHLPVCGVQFRGSQDLPVARNLFTNRSNNLRHIRACNDSGQSIEGGSISRMPCVSLGMDLLHILWVENMYTQRYRRGWVFPTSQGSFYKLLLRIHFLSSRDGMEGVLGRKDAGGYWKQWKRRNLWRNHCCCLPSQPLSPPEYRFRWIWTCLRNQPFPRVSIFQPRKINMSKAQVHTWNLLKRFDSFNSRFYSLAKQTVWAQGWRTQDNPLDYQSNAFNCPSLCCFILLW